MSEVQTGTIKTKVPARLDRLPWSRWHWMVIIGLGTVWILDGLEVTIVGQISGQISMPGSGIHITQSQITGFGAATYVAGACIGALFFGWLTDRFGRKKLFMITLGVYLASTALTAFSFAPWWFFLFRFLTGFGIGGEYAAINSAIDELIPSRHRGRIDIIINGTFWAGAAVGALISVPATNDLPVFWGWRVCFGLGVVLGLVVLLVRRNVPESPRWLFIHGRDREAEDLVTGIEHRVEEETGTHLEEPGQAITIRQRKSIGFVTIAHTMFARYPRRTDPGLLAVHRPGLPVQRDHVRLRPDPDRLLPRQDVPGLLLRGDRRGQPARAADPRAAVRLGRPQADDRRHLHRCPASCCWAPRGCSAPAT